MASSGSPSSRLTFSSIAHGLWSYASQADIFQSASKPTNGKSSIGRGGDSGSTEISLQDNLSLPIAAQPNQLFIMFGVKGPRRTLELAQIGTEEQSDDHTLFTELRNKYKILRGFWRYWFSVWRLNHCDFVKVSKAVSTLQGSYTSNSRA